MHPLGGQIGGADVNQNSVGMGVGAALLSQNDRKSNKALDAPECFHTGKPLPARAGGASPARPAPAEPLHAARLFRLRPPRPPARRSRATKRFSQSGSVGVSGHIWPHLSDEAVREVKLRFPAYGR